MNIQHKFQGLLFETFFDYLESASLDRFGRDYIRNEDEINQLAESFVEQPVVGEVVNFLTKRL